MASTNYIFHIVATVNAHLTRLILLLKRSHATQMNKTLLLQRERRCFTYEYTLLTLAFAVRAPYAIWLLQMVSGIHL